MTKELEEIRSAIGTFSEAMLSKMEEGIGRKDGWDSVGTLFAYRPHQGRTRRAGGRTIVAEQEGRAIRMRRYRQFLHDAPQGSCKQERKNEMSFISEWNEKEKEALQIHLSKGWAAKTNNGECIALMHSELSEALEALRHGDPPDDHIPEFSGVEAELADVVIRVMSFAAERGLRIAEAIEAKMEYNKTRPEKHGGKLF